MSEIDKPKPYVGPNNKHVLVEVKSTKEGSEYIWYPAKLVNSTNRIAGKVLVEYQTLLSDCGLKQRKEYILLSHFRPMPPQSSQTIFNISDVVDAFYCDGWHEGVVDAEMAGQTRYGVRLKNSEAELVWFKPDQLRPHYERLDGKWVKSPNVKVTQVVSEPEKETKKAIPKLERQEKTAKRTSLGGDATQPTLKRSRRILEKTSNLNACNLKEAKKKVMKDTADCSPDFSKPGSDSSIDPVKLGQEISSGQEENTTGCSLKFPKPGSDSSIDPVKPGNEISSGQERNTTEVDPEGNLHEEKIAEVDPESNLPEEKTAEVDLESNLHEKNTVKVDRESNLPEENTVEVDPESKLQEENTAAIDSESNIDVGVVSDVKHKRVDNKDSMAMNLQQTEDEICPTDQKTKQLFVETISVTSVEKSTMDQNVEIVADKKCITCDDGSQCAENTATVAVPVDFSTGESRMFETGSPCTEFKTGLNLLLASAKPVTDVAMEKSLVKDYKTGESAENQDLPFIKSSPVWKTVESLKIFRTSQTPHFRPLAGYKEACREGTAIGHMITFSNLAESASKLKISDPREAFTAILDPLPTLEEFGFNINLIEDRIKTLLSVKERQEELGNQLVEAEDSIAARTALSTQLHAEINDDTDKINDIQEKINELTKKMKELEENRSLNMSVNDSLTTQVTALQARKSTIREEMLNGDASFESLAGASW